MSPPPEAPDGSQALLAGALTRACQRFPERPAVSADDRTLSYRELDQRVGRFAEAMTEAGVRAGSRLGVLLPRGLDAICMIHAGLRLSAFVAPLEPNEPITRLARTIESGGLEHVVFGGRGNWRTAAPSYDSRALRLSEADLWLATSATAPLPVADREAGGYLLYTSGSTGRPKGVLLSQRNVWHFANWAAGRVGLRPTDRVAAQAAFTFDLSTFDLFASVIAGACVDVVPQHLTLFAADLVDWLTERHASVLYAVPSLYRAMLLDGDLEQRWPPDLRLALFAGEPFPLPLLQRCRRAAPAAGLFNLYGPTETNVCTFEQLAADWSAADGLSIGVPIPGDEVELVDEDGATSDAGELVVAGDTVLLGYLEGGRFRDPTRPTAFADGRVRRAYWTGDLATRDADRRLWLRGRADSQVKRNGYRIELQDVQSAALEIAGVRSAAVVSKTVEPHAGQLWAYVDAGELTPEAVSATLARLLPRRMLPDRVVVLGQLPLTSRGKVDTRALAALPDERNG